MTGRRWLLLLGLVAAAVAFLLFRPDKLFVDDVVDEGLEEAFAAPATTEPPATTGLPTTIPPPNTVPTGSASTTLAPSTLPPTTTTTVTALPVIEASGELFGIDHSAIGTAVLYRQGDSWVLRFEDGTDIQNGPDLYVWLVGDTDWYQPGEYLDLGKLKGNVGGQNYQLPPEFDPEEHRHVLIWCLRFAVPFAAAELG